MTIQTTDTMTAIEQVLHIAYLDYRNDFLTIEGYASYYGYPLEQAHQIIELGRLITQRHEVINNIKGVL